MGAAGKPKGNEDTMLLLPVDASKVASLIPEGFALLPASAISGGGLSLGTEDQAVLVLTHPDSPDVR